MPVATTQTGGLVDTWGGKFQNEIQWTGPTSYANGTGEVLPPSAFGCPNNLLFATGSVSVSGTYRAVCRPQAASGYTKWNVQFCVMSSGAEVSNATNLSAETFTIFGMGV